MTTTTTPLLVSACMAIGGAVGVCALVRSLYFRFLSGSSKAGNENSDSNAQNKEETVDDRRNLACFKQFDTVEGCSDHQYKNLNNNPHKAWNKKILEEWKILQDNLPETIFVRAYESRMDLMRAAIIGADETPYHDGIFFFDIMFPSSYPRAPPKVWYRSGGLRLNPNLYSNGRVCLSLLGTWAGSENERWLPNKSTMLQVLLSIQALILNSKPYFNEPGNEAYKDSPSLSQPRWKTYNEEVFILSIKTMIYSMKNPPKDLVASHFGNRGNYILKACRAYSEGAEVGSDIRKRGKIKGRSSMEFKLTLAKVVGVLTEALTKNDQIDNRLRGV